MCLENIKNVTLLDFFDVFGDIQLIQNDKKCIKRIKEAKEIVFIERLSQPNFMILSYMKTFLSKNDQFSNTKF